MSTVFFTSSESVSQKLKLFSRENAAAYAINTTYFLILKFRMILKVCKGYVILYKVCMQYHTKRCNLYCV